MSIRATGLLICGGLLLLATSAFAGDPIPGVWVGGGKNPGGQLVAGANGPSLVDWNGMSLYAFEGDAPGKSNCRAACAAELIPLTVVEKGFATGDWSIFVRADGKRQWAWRGKPLYRSVNDKQPGDTNGASAGIRARLIGGDYGHAK